MKEKIQIIWFKKNLRTEDNEILANINPNIPVLGVYFFENDIIESPDFSSFHMQFILQSLENLKKNLKKLSIHLIILESTLPEGFKLLTEYYDLKKIYNTPKTTTRMRRDGKKVLSDFLKNRSRNYSYHISKPYESRDSCSRLSAYITYGCLSVKYIYTSTLTRRAELAKVSRESGLSRIKQLDFFLSRLHWQSHFIQKLEDEPSIEWKNLNSEFDSIRNTENILSKVWYPLYRCNY